jgi:raffinose/stachyose/melibiose transport system permease protein
VTARGATTSLYRIRLRQALPWLAVPIVLYVFMVITPLVGAVSYSLNHTFTYKLVWAGIDNYRTLISDHIYWLSLKNNLIVIVVSTLFQIGPAFLIMAMMASRLVAAENTVKAIFFFPVVISPVITAYIWQVMYSSKYGIINKLLDLVHLGFLKQNWLADPSIIMTSISIPLAWQYIGFYLVILMAGFTSIDRELLEAAAIDGGTGVQRTRYVILPLMRSSINVSLLLCISGGVKIFDQIYAMSGGGPGYASSVLAMYSYNVSFSQNDYGYGSAIAVSMLVISFVVIAVLTRIRRATGNE